mmetsp:Transcript_4254/g.13406  ORF Transcript_4254/g.13406 Transcript_4254/m.13406 type:complete len:387 (-) Transcript_4254:523-1683(-)
MHVRQEFVCRVQTVAQELRELMMAHQPHVKDAASAPTKGLDAQLQVRGHLVGSRPHKPREWTAALVDSRPLSQHDAAARTLGERRRRSIRLGLRWWPWEASGERGSCTRREMVKRHRGEAPRTDARATLVAQPPVWRGHLEATRAALGRAIGARFCSAHHQVAPRRCRRGAGGRRRWSHVLSAGTQDRRKPEGILTNREGKPRDHGAASAATVPPPHLEFQRVDQSPRERGLPRGAPRIPTQRLIGANTRRPVPHSLTEALVRRCRVQRRDATVAIDDEYPLLDDGAPARLLDGELERRHARRRRRRKECSKRCAHTSRLWVYGLGTFVAESFQWGAAQGRVRSRSCRRQRACGTEGATLVARWLPARLTARGARDQQSRRDGEPR